MLVNFNPAVSVGFRANEAPNGENFQELINRPGTYAKPDASGQASTQQPAEKKKSSIGKKVLGAVVAVAVIAGALVAMRKWAPNVFKLERNGELTGFKKCLDYVTTGIGKAGEWIWGILSKPFSNKAKEEIVEEVIDNASEVINAAT